MTSQELQTFLVTKRVTVGLTQAELAKLAGVAQATVSKIEKYGVCLSVRTLCLLLDAYGLKISIEDKTHE